MTAITRHHVKWNQTIVLQALSAWGSQSLNILFLSLENRDFSRVRKSWWVSGWRPALVEVERVEVVGKWWRSVAWEACCVKGWRASLSRRAVCAERAGLQTSVHVVRRAFQTLRSDLSVWEFPFPLLSSDVWYHSGLTLFFLTISWIFKDLDLIYLFLAISKIEQPFIALFIF